jgi:DNA-directed RNA polymerase specialized sigma24 family protein
MSSYIYWGNRAASTIEENHRPRALSPREEDEVIAAYEAGMSQPKIGEVFGVSHGTVSNILKRHGVKTREGRFYRALSSKEEDEVIAAYEAGMSQREIGEVFGVHHNAVYNILKRHGIKAREPGFPRALSSEEERALVGAYLGGSSGMVLAEMFGISFSSVYNILKRHGIKTRGGGIPLALSPKEERVLISAYLGGSSGLTLARIFGISDNSVYKILKRHGVKTRELWHHRLSPKEEDEVISAYESGMSQEEISEVVGVAHGTVSNILKRHGVKTRGKWPHRALSPREEDEVIAAYEAGMSQAEIGEVFGVDQTTVSKILKRHGVKTRVRWHHRAFSPKRNPVDGVSTVLALAAVSALVLGVSMARGARLR